MGYIGLTVCAGDRILKDRRKKGGGWNCRKHCGYQRRIQKILTGGHRVIRGTMGQFMAWSNGNALSGGAPSNHGGGGVCPLCPPGRSASEPEWTTSDGPTLSHFCSCRFPYKSVVLSAKRLHETGSSMICHHGHSLTCLDNNLIPCPVAESRDKCVGLSDLSDTFWAGPVNVPNLLGLTSSVCLSVLLCAFCWGQ